MSCSAVNLYEKKRSEIIIQDGDFLGIVKNHFKIVHLKGFGSGIDFEDEKIKKLTQQLIDILTDPDKNIIIVWDGDEYNDKSYTHVIYKIMKMNITNVHFAAFVLESAIESFKKTWTPVLSDKNINVIMMENSVDKSLSEPEQYAQLGIAGLKLTESTDVYCLGGGAVLEAEYNYWNKYENKRGINWHIFNFFRYVKGNIQNCSLIPSGDEKVEMSTF